MAYLVCSPTRDRQCRSNQPSAISLQPLSSNLPIFQFSNLSIQGDPSGLPLLLTTYFLLAIPRFSPLSQAFTFECCPAFSCLLIADSCQLLVENIGPDSYRDEPMTLSLRGEYRSRTDDLLLAKQAL